MALRMNQTYNVGQRAAHRETLKERFAKYMEENKAVILGGLAALNREGNAYKTYYMQQENKR